MWYICGTVFSECIIGNSKKASQLVFLPFRVFGLPKICELHHFRLFCSASVSRRAKFKPQLPQGQRTLQDFLPALRGGEQPAELVG
jgi:hypothetical protein